MIYRIIRAVIFVFLFLSVLGATEGDYKAAAGAVVMALGIIYFLAESKGD